MLNFRIRYEFSNEESVEQNETPILRRFNKKTSGASILLCMESETKMELLHTVKEPSDWGSSSFSPCFSDSNDDEELPQKSSEHTDLDGPTLIHLPEYSHSKLSRAKLHRKFSEFYKWDYVVLRSIAPAISKIRHDVLSTATVETNQRREIVMSIYKKCDEGANKELMALCCAMFFLNDDVHYDELTSPEEYAAEKYIRRRKRDFSC
uniref:Uncharacterized protein n=1 Tax=Caenorhabditis japonica TaxID=281687 RepID=A0A8R1DLF1_CAEJA